MVLTLDAAGAVISRSSSRPLNDRFGRLLRASGPDGSLCLDVESPRGVRTRSARRPPVNPGRDPTRRARCALSSGGVPSALESGDLLLHTSFGIGLTLSSVSVITDPSASHAVRGSEAS